MEERLILTGFMGAGKSSVARKIAKALSWTAVDLDDLIVRRRGKSIPEIFKSEGEEVFRKLETEALAEALGMKRAVIAAGGGILTREENQNLLRGQLVVNLNASFEELLRRVKSSKTVRPLAAGPVEEFKKRFDERKPLYDAIPNQVDTEGKTTAEIADEIVSRFFGEKMEKPVENR